MSNRLDSGLGSDALRSRLRQPVERPMRSIDGPVRPGFGPRVRLASASIKRIQQSQLEPKPIASTQSRLIQADVVHIQKPRLNLTDQPPITANFKLIAPQPFARPAHPKQQQSVVLRRQTVRHPAARPEPTTPKRSKLQYALVGMAIFIFGVGLFVSFLTAQTNQTAKTQVAALATKSEQADGSAAPNAPPTETKPTTASMGSYRVAPDVPQQIIIPKLYVFARVRSLTVNSKNELQAPGNIYDAGWYKSSAKPGDGAGSGAMLIDGHVHGPTLPGVFANLKKLVAGDEIQIVRGDGKKFSYTIVKSQNLPADNLDIGSALLSAQPGKAALNLITCGGPYDKKTGEYSERTIIYAIQS